jgi:aminotransferase
MVRLSEVSKAVKPSLTRKLFNMAKQYDDVIDFTLGDPDVQPHQAIKNASCFAIQAGKTRYSQNAGLLELRETISKYYLQSEGYKYDAVTEIMVTVGAMEGLYLSLLSILDLGDEVIIPAPYYVNYAQMVSLCHAKPIIVDNPKNDELIFNICDIEKAITSKTRAIIINTPSNPSGRLIPQDKIKALADLSIKYDLIVISDEVYKCLIYLDEPFKSIVDIEGMRERTVLINSLSKEFCMTGYRIGYVLAPQEIIATMTKIQENICACAPLPSQYAAIEALNGRNQYTAHMKETFRHRRDLLVSEIQSTPFLKCREPDATFYLMVDISDTGLKSEEFAYTCLKEAHVALVPGITYGLSCDNYVRIAFTLNDDKIREGISRIRKMLNKFKK